MPSTVSVSQGRKSKDNGMSLGGVSRHWQSTRWTQRRAVTFGKSDLVSTVGDKIYE